MDPVLVLCSVRDEQGLWDDESWHREKGAVVRSRRKCIAKWTITYLFGSGPLGQCAERVLHECARRCHWSQKCACYKLHLCFRISSHPNTCASFSWVSILGISVAHFLFGIFSTCTSSTSPESMRLHILHNMVLPSTQFRGLGCTQHTAQVDTPRLRSSKAVDVSG